MDKQRIDVAIAIIFDRPHRNILICQRRDNAILGGFWEFPGGKRQADETLAQCAVREAAEEVGIAITCAEAWPPIAYDYAHALVRLHPFLCRHVSGEPQLLAVQAFRWIAPEEVRSYDFPPANAPLLDMLVRGRFQGG